MRFFFSVVTSLHVPIPSLYLYLGIWKFNECYIFLRLNTFFSDLSFFFFNLETSSNQWGIQDFRLGGMLHKQLLSKARAQNFSCKFFLKIMISCKNVPSMYLSESFTANFVQITITLQCKLCLAILLGQNYEYN